MTDLFSPLTLRGVTFRNRIGVSPMCMYSCAEDGLPTDWHMMHLGSRAVSGPGMTMVEASAVVPEGRITPSDVGIWSDAHIAPHQRLATALAGFGTVPAIQIAHAGRKASRDVPWEKPAPAAHGWQTLGPSAAAFGDFLPPKAMSEEEILSTIAAFAAAAQRSVTAGYKLIEIHGAHGYLIHQFLSPISNQRNDRWGGDFAGRTRLAAEVTKAVRAAIPDDIALSIRISHTDWVEGGWDTAQSVELAKLLKGLGVDIVDVSSGGLDAGQKIALGPGYQVPGSDAVKKGAAIPTMAVGLITEPAQAQAILSEGKADMILLARALLRDPYWTFNAAVALGRTSEVKIPPQYDRSWSTGLGRLAIDRAVAEPLRAL
ncbi:NADH:flavin oxidoreductase/NADH oxidase [Roseococcus sp. YIM B11640]|uniref:NADH:flavin oxidoreductase/NADH oxidase n=1 Tax=Roseococcus sp. YIM B11640 TaxID=3133973 RepID=UPI003C799DCC